MSGNLRTRTGTKYARPPEAQALRQAEIIVYGRDKVCQALPPMKAQPTTHPSPDSINKTTDQSRKSPVIHR